MHGLGFGGLLGCGCHLGRAGDKGERKKRTSNQIKIGFVVLFHALLQGILGVQDAALCWGSGQDGLGEVEHAQAFCLCLEREGFYHIFPHFFHFSPGENTERSPPIFIVWGNLGRVVSHKSQIKSAATLWFAKSFFKAGITV